MQVVPWLYLGPAVILWLSSRPSSLAVYKLILLSTSSVGPSYISRLWICREWYHETVSTKSIQRQTCQRKVKENEVVRDLNTLLRVNVPASATRQALRSCQFDSHAITFIITIIQYWQCRPDWWLSNPDQKLWSILWILYMLVTVCHENWGEIFKMMLDLFHYICFGWQADLPRNFPVLHLQKGLHDFISRCL